MAYNISKKLEGNVRAIRIAMDFQKGQPLSSEDLSSLKGYAGFGGIKAILYPYGSMESWQANGATNDDLKLYPDIMALHDLLKDNHTEQEYKEIVASVRNSVLTAFYTPEVIPRTIYNVLKERGIAPKRLYEPSAGSGVFINEALQAFTGLEQVTAVEKDRLTGLILSALNSTLHVKSDTHISGLEQAPVTDNGTYDLVVSNIPFGNFPIFDASFPSKDLSGRIHNYFFAKGLDKLADGGLMAYITTDAFLNSPSNQGAREYLFKHADLISVAVMPDNLMKDTGNTEAPSHLLIVQKNNSKEKLSWEEDFLNEVREKENEFGRYPYNYLLSINDHDVVIGNSRKPGTNQYGKATEVIWQDGDINQIGESLHASLAHQFRNRFNMELFKKAQAPTVLQSAPLHQKLTYLPLPENKAQGSAVQLGLFDLAPAENSNRASAYLNSTDEGVIRKESARLIGTVRNTENPGHENIVLLTAKQLKGERYLYRLHSNLGEVNNLSVNWMNASLLAYEINAINTMLNGFGQAFRFEGDQTLESLFRFHEKEIGPFTELLPFYRQGTLVVHMGQAGKLDNPDPEFKQAAFHPLGGKGDINFYRSYIALRDNYLQLSAHEIEGNAISSGEREALNGQYDRFVSSYGMLNSPANRRRITEDSAFGVSLLASLERKEGEHYVKSDILTHSVQKTKERFVTDDPIEALAHSLNDTGGVNLDFIKVALGIDEIEAIKRLGDSIYLNAGSGSWETADRYLSGNVVEKLHLARAHNEKAPGNLQYERSVTALEQIQPERIPFEMLDFNLGERWIPTDYYRQYATELFEKETDISYFPSLDTFKVATAHNIKIDREYAVTPQNGRITYGYTILEHALENTTPFFTYEVSVGGGKTIRVPDNDAIQLAHQKIEQIRNGFVDWLKELPDTDKKYIENLYNDTFNCYVLREYDGSHLTFPGLDKKALEIDDLYSSQKNAAWRIVQNRGALVDHEVGLGKTLTMIVAAQEMKRLKTIHKPMIIALKANVDQIAETYRKAYPAAKILAPGQNDFTPAQRTRLLHEIKNNNWDCIILTHDQFGKIPQSPEIQKQIFQEELDNIERDLDTLRELGGDISKKMLKGLEIRKNNLEGSLKGILRDIEEKKDTGINFKEMGIDHLFVDESHKFKNLTFTTRHNRVAGLGTTEGSQKALNMLFAVRTLQQRFDSDLCVTFLSGTPISNSLTEMYLLFKYLRPREMERQRIENFDGWAAVFAKKTTDFEFSVTNEIVAKERFRHFIKVPELAMFYNEITDYKTAKHINLDKPELQETLVNIAPSDEQREFIKNLMAFAKTGNAELIGRAKLTPKEDLGRMLIATNYAKKMAADLRLIDEDKYSDHPHNKVNTAARNIASIYEASTPHKGTQIVFSDIGTPKPDSFNMYDALKDRLVGDFNIPPSQVTYIHDWTDRRKPELFRKMNKGEIRILIGSTEKAGTGLNVQERVVAMHHLDIPWRPSDLGQRNGRGGRQGNKLAKEHYDNKVQNFIYATEQSLDNYKFNLLKNKETFIAQMKNCELNVRTIDEGSIDEKSGMNFSEYIAILSGDTSLLEKSKLEKKVAVMESLKTVYFREASRTRIGLEKMQNERFSTAATLEKLTDDASHYISRLQYTPDGAKENPVTLSGLASSDPEAIGKQIISLYEGWKPPEGQAEQKIGSLYGFDLFIQRKYEAYEEKGSYEYRYSNSFYAQRQTDGIKYTYNDGLPNIDNPKLAARHFLNAIDRVDSLKEKYDLKLKELTTEIPKLEKLLEKSFAQENELQQMKNELAGLEREITIKIQESQLKQQQEHLSNAGDEGTVEISHTVAAEQEAGARGPTVQESEPVTKTEPERIRSRMRL